MKVDKDIAALFIDEEVAAHRHHGLDHAGAESLVQPRQALLPHDQPEAVHCALVAWCAAKAGPAMAKALDLQALLDHIQGVRGHLGAEARQRATHQAL